MGKDLMLIHHFSSFSSKFQAEKWKKCLHSKENQMLWTQITLMKWETFLWHSYIVWTKVLGHTSVLLPQVYKIKHLDMQSAFTNISERMGCSKELTETVFQQCWFDMKHIMLVKLHYFFLIFYAARHIYKFVCFNKCSSVITEVLHKHKKTLVDLINGCLFNKRVVSTKIQVKQNLRAKPIS